MVLIKDNRQTLALRFGNGQGNYKSEVKNKCAKLPSVQ